MRFKNRIEAGRKLAKLLKKYKRNDAVVYALPRGGVVLGSEISKELGAPLDLIITRKIGHPFQSEYAICAVAEDGDMICNEDERARVDKKWLENETAKERQEAGRRREAYLKGRELISVQGKTAIIVDDGVATGLTMRLAIQEAKHNNPARIIVAVPVIPADTAKKIKKEVDEFIALEAPVLFFGSIGEYYDEFPQVEDEEVIKFLEENKI